MRPLQAHCHAGLGTLYATTGRREQARTALSAAIDTIPCHGHDLLAAADGGRAGAGALRHHSRCLWCALRDLLRGIGSDPASRSNAETKEPCWPCSSVPSPSGRGFYHRVRGPRVLCDGARTPGATVSAQGAALHPLVKASGATVSAQGVALPEGRGISAMPKEVFWICSSSGIAIDPC